MWRTLKVATLIVTGDPGGVRNGKLLRRPQLRERGLSRRTSLQTKVKAKNQDIFFKFLIQFSSKLNQYLFDLSLGLAYDH
jgi:hypothetical protein